MPEIDLGNPAPERGDVRQYWFMAAMRAFTKEQEGILSRPMTASVVTFGCQMNARDSEKLSGILEECGFVLKEDEDADFVLYNTCTVRDNADQHLYGRLGTVHHLKKANRFKKVGICGCMMQEKTAVEKIRKSYGFVDLIFGTYNIYCLAEYLYRIYHGEKHVIELWQKSDEIVEDLPAERKYPFKSGVNIILGCDNFCSYCIVPYVRGREKSRAPRDILAEVRRLADDGVKEIMLLGQNVDSYGKTLEPEVTFAELLKAVARIDGIHRIRFMSNNPKDISRELVEVIRDTPKIARQIHLPLQSGSDRILKAMNRHYTKEQYLAMVDLLRSGIPDLAISTDIIVGFPGETAADVDETIDVVRKASFDNAFTFIYSMRAGTPAARMEQVPEEEKKANFARLLAVVQETAKKQALLYKGRTMEALIEEPDPHEDGMLTGRLSNNMIVHVKGDPSCIGNFYPVRLDTCKGFYYYGTIAGDRIA